MPKCIPYFVLIFISAVLFILSWRKTADKRMIILYLCIAGFIYYFEFIILVLFESYQYEPGLFKDPYFDNIFGATVSNGFIVPSATVFIAVFDLGVGWIVFIDLCLLGIEELFLLLHLYQHFWWKTIYTGLSLLIIFALGKWVWDLLRFHSKRFLVRYGALYFANVTIQTTFLYYMSAFFNLFYYRINWFEEPTRGHIAFEALLAYADSILFAAAVATRANSFWKTLVVVCCVGFNVLLHEWGILDVPGYWTFALIALAQAGYLVILGYFQQILEKSS